MDSSSSSAILMAHDKEYMVDPFLVEALQNPRHRLTILRMELDVQRFLKSPEIQQFEFQQFPTPYLRLAAHRVAQHYELTTAVQENLDGEGNKIVARKSADSRYPAVCLSEIPAKHQESEKGGKIKVLIKPRQSSSSGSADNELGTKLSPSRTVEDREEEYERARARIFSSIGSSILGDNPQKPMVGKDQGLIRNDSELNRNLVNDPEKTYVRDGSASCVAIIRDVEKDRFDPDYDRSYGRYVMNFPTDQGYGLPPFQVEKPQLPYMQYSNHAFFPQYGLVPRTHSVNYGFPCDAVMAPFGAMGMNMSSADGAYLQRQNHAVMYAHSYEQFRFSHAISQTPFGQHPPSLNHPQNLMNRS